MNIDDVADELFEMQAQMSDGAYVTIMNLLKEKHDRKPKKLGHSAGCDKWVELVGNVCCCTRELYNQSDKTSMYAVFPLLKYTEEKYDGNVAGGDRIAADMIKYEFGESELPLDTCIMATELLKRIRSMFSSICHLNIVDICKINFMIENPLSVVDYSDGISENQMKKHIIIHSTCREICSYGKLNALFNETCNQLEIENPFEKWQQLFWHRYGINYDFSARPHTCGYESWKDHVGELCCCNIIYYTKCNKNVLCRIMPFLEKLKHAGSRFPVPKDFGPGKLIGKDAATAIVSVIEHLRKLYSRGRERHIIDTAKFIFMIEFPILIDTDPEVRDAMYEQICNRATPAWTLWKRKFEERYGAALIKDN